MIAQPGEPGPGLDPAAGPNPVAGERTWSGDGRGIRRLNHLLHRSVLTSGGTENRTLTRQADAAPGPGGARTNRACLHSKRRRIMLLGSREFVMPYPGESGRRGSVGEARVVQLPSDLGR